MRCWNCKSELLFLRAGNCFFCEKEPETNNIDPEEQGVVLCGEHRSLHLRHLRKLGEILQIQFTGHYGKFELGFEEFKNEVQKKIQKLIKDASLWLEIYEDQTEMIKTNLEKWKGMIEQKK